MSQYENKPNLAKSFNLLSNHNSLVQASNKTAEDILCNNTILPESISLEISLCTAVQSFLYPSSTTNDISANSAHGTDHCFTGLKIHTDSLKKNMFPNSV